MKRFMILLLACLMLTACGQSEQEEGNRSDVRFEDRDRDVRDGDEREDGNQSDARVEDQDRDARGEDEEKEEHKYSLIATKTDYLTEREDETDVCRWEIRVDDDGYFECSRHRVWGDPDSVAYYMDSNRLARYNTLCERIITDLSNPSEVDDEDVDTVRWSFDLYVDDRHVISFDNKYVYNNENWSNMADFLDALANR